MKLPAQEARKRGAVHPASPHKRLAIHFSNYSLGSLLTVLAGVFSFPFLTRIFSMADYGIMNLISVAVTASVAVAKLGVQHSIIRFHSEIKTGKRPFTMQQFFSTAILGMAATGTLVASLGVVAVALAPAGWLGEGRTRGLLALASIQVLVGAVDSALMNFLRAEQRTSMLRNYGVAKKYVGLALIVATLLLISRSLTGFYWATVIAEAGGTLVLAWMMLRDPARPRISRSAFSRPLYRDMLDFGIPMMIGYEFAGTILSVGDRYVIHGMIGSAPLGLYSAAYNMCQYVQTVLIGSVGFAIMPIYMQMWDEKGRAETTEFIARSLRTYVLFAVPMIAGIAAVGAQLLPFLASEKYASGAVIVSWVIAGMVIDGASVMVGAGLFIERRTRTIMIVVLSNALLNIGLNVLLIPSMGIRGSAAATLIAYATQALTMGLAARRYLTVALPWRTLLRAGLGAAIMYPVVMSIDPGGRLVTIAVRAIVGATIYLALLGTIDPDMRKLVRAAWARVRKGTS